MREPTTVPAVTTSKLSVAADLTVNVGCVRYFSVTGGMAAGLESALGIPLPDARRASGAGVGEDAVLLAWRSPSETLLITASAARFETVSTLCAAAADGCFVDQTHGLCVLRASGEHLSELFSRLGGSDLQPAVGESKRGRLADLPISAVRTRAEDTLLIVERAYREHLMNWIGETARDLDIPTVVAP